MTILARARNSAIPSPVQATDAEFSARLAVKGLMHRLKSNGPTTFSLITTRRPSVVFEAFDDPGFPWWLQAQALLLSPPNAGRPAIGSTELLACIEAPADAVFRDSDPFVALLRPGVDGDVAGLITHRNHAHERAFMAALQRRATEAGVRVEALSEREFADALAR